MISQTPFHIIQKIFMVIVITNLLINMDHGIIPAASLNIENSLDLTNSQLGILGSLVYAGIVLSGLIVGPLFLKYNPKSIVLISLLIIIVTLTLFPQKYSSIYIYFITRFFTGMAQAPLIVYFPVWVDSFGYDEKTMWLTLLQGGVPCGVFFGYVVSGVISNLYKWEYSFYIQIFLLLPCFISLFFVDDQDFNVKAENYQKQPQSYFQLIKKLSQSKVSIMSELCIQRYIYVPYLHSLLYTLQQLEYNFGYRIIQRLFSNTHKSQQIQYLPQYLQLLRPQDVSTVDLQFNVQEDIKRKKQFIFCFISAVLGSISAFPIPITTTLFQISILIWLLLFFGGSIVPPLTGIMLNSVEPELRSFANSNATMFYNLLGYLPAPTIYGVLTSYQKKGGIYCIAYMPIVSIICLGYGILTYQQQTGI